MKDKRERERGGKGERMREKERRSRILDSTRGWLVILSKIRINTELVIW